MLQFAAPALPTFNLLSTKTFYTERLGFSSEFVNNQLLLKRDGVTIVFFEQKEMQLFTPAFCYIFVQNLEDLYSQLSSQNLIKPAGKLVEKNGRLKEFIIADTNGHELRFVER